jgi:hypothetical protein
VLTLEQSKEAIELVLGVVKKPVNTAKIDGLKRQVDPLNVDPESKPEI